MSSPALSSPAVPDPGTEPARDLPKVYLFAEVRLGTGDYSAVALAQDGAVLARHICSNPSWFPVDLHERPTRHAAYTEHFGGYGDGRFYDLVEDVPPAEVLARVADITEVSAQ